MIAPIVPELSINIPAYNEEHRLPRSLTKIRDYLGRRNLAPTQVGIIVVDDGDIAGSHRSRNARIVARGSFASPGLKRTQPRQGL
jgi:cellulose synthase/poly-beta-1,6-N-acetylglucosamine synthase-like glycosyltransferase